MEEPLLRIGELAAFYNVSVRALRIYEKKGIIVPAVVDPQTGYRYYTADQVHQLNVLLELKSMGFSLSEIRAVLRGKLGDRQLTALLSRKAGVWREAIASAQNKIDAIEAAMERISSSGGLNGAGELTDEERAWLLVKMVCVEDLRGQSLLSEAIWL